LIRVKNRSIVRFKFQRTKAAANIAVNPINHLATNTQSLKNLCQYFDTDQDVGVCEKLDIVCHPWNCEYLEKCGNDVRIIV